MTDVEKYGVFALVFVMGVLGLIVFYEPDSGQANAGASGQSVIIRSAADVPLAAGVSAQRAQGRGPSPAALRDGSQRSSEGGGRRAPRDGQVQANRPANYRVKSPADGAGSFEFSEPPLRYPGQWTSLGRSSADGTIVHVVRKGETLSDISKSYYGTSRRHREILALNPGLVPTKMRPGDEVIVSLPSTASGISETAQNGSNVGTKSGNGEVSPTAPVKARTGKTYVVQKGDTLGQIAQRLLGTVKKVDELFAANKGVLDSPHDLKPGMELSIP